MKIAKNTVVVIDYVLKNDEGQVLHSSEGGKLLSYLHGTDGIIPGLERELDGKQVGDQLQVAVAAKDGYGERDKALQRDVPRGQFEDGDLELGMLIRADKGGGPIVGTIVEIADEVVTIDGNHPLAGVNLNFEVTIREVREATAEEVEHGHAHGPGGHLH